MDVLSSVNLNGSLFLHPMPPYLYLLTRVWKNATHLMKLTNLNRP